MFLTMKEAAERLGGGVSHEAVRQIAEDHGHLIKVGRKVCVLEEELPELIDKCRVKPKAPASTSAPTQARGSSETPDSQTGARARQVAQKLKRISRNTSSLQ